MDTVNSEQINADQAAGRLSRTIQLKTVSSDFNSRVISSGFHQIMVYSF